MSDPLSGPYGCEDEAREALLAAAGTWQTASRPLGRLADLALSLRWHRSGAGGFLMTPDLSAGRSVTADHVTWTPLRRPGPSASGADEGNNARNHARNHARSHAGNHAGNNTRPHGQSPASQRPDGQWLLHRHLYLKRPAVDAIVRSCPPFSTTLSCIARVQREGIPAFLAGIRPAGGDSIRCAAASFDHVDAALEDRPACLLTAQGLLATGATLRDAIELAASLEALAQIHWQLLQVGATA